MKRTVLFILLLMFLLFSIPMRTCAEEAEESGVKAYVLMEPRTETVLEEQNGREKLNVGYLSKLMALYVIALDIETGKYTLDKELTASDSVTGTKGSVAEWLALWRCAVVHPPRVHGDNAHSSPASPRRPGRRQCAR